jgi:hypothetical protein
VSLQAQRAHAFCHMLLVVLLLLVLLLLLCQRKST